MSYILDALKKSEQERGNGNIPNVQTVHTSSLNYNSKKTYWPYFLITIASLNLAAILYFIFNEKENDPIESSITKSEPLEQTQTSLPNAPEVKGQITVIDSSDQTKTETMISDKPHSNNAADIRKNTNSSIVASRESNNSNEVIEFYDLPESTRQSLPSIVISAHVYSSNPLLRSIVINNNSLEEGGYILDGLILHEITFDGAVFSYNDMLIHHGIVNTWQ